MARSESLQNLLWLNISELSVIKNVTTNYLETSYILFFHNFAIYKERFDYRYKDKLIFKKHTSLLSSCSFLRIEITYYFCFPLLLLLQIMKCIHLFAKISQLLDVNL